MSRAPLRSGRDTKIVRAIQLQADFCFGAIAGIQCSCMPLMSMYWSIFISVTTWDGPDLDMILENGDRLFKSLNIDYLQLMIYQGQSIFRGFS